MSDATGQKRPLLPKHVWAIRVRLEIAANVRDLALFNLAIDSKLRGCDLVRLKVADVYAAGQVKERASIIQSKTRKPVRFEIIEGTRKSIAAWLDNPLMIGSEYLWPGRFHERLHISTRQYARLVRGWVTSIGLEPTSYGTHTMRRTKVAQISLIVDQLNCAPIAAQMCFADLLVRVGALAGANGRLAPENYRGVSISDTETSIRDVLAAIDIDAIERALRDGVCEPVDFLTPLNNPNFYLGVDVEPGHITAGLVAERPRSRSALVEGIEQRRAALIVGPSGAGKSALMWEAANTLRHTVRWFRIRRLSAADIPSLRQLVRTFRASEDSPLGFVMDDVGRNGPESWGTLLKEALSVPGVVLLGSVREEDVTLIAERARAAEIRADPDDELAERLWRELREAEKTNWASW